MPSNRIDQRFQALAAQGRKALIAYVTGGYPSLPQMDRAVKDLESAGADLIEIGVPFSDPIADGPAIQRSSQAALELGITLEKLLVWAKKFRRRSQLPIVFMTYMNPIFHRGFARFAREAKASGVDGVIVPDLIPEEAKDLRLALDRESIRLIFLVAPTTPAPRRRMIARNTRGFLYAVTLTGVTGARRELPRGVSAFLADLRRYGVPVAAGFGISGAAQAKVAARSADGIIVGSAFIQRLAEKKPVAGLARELRHALDSL